METPEAGIWCMALDLVETRRVLLHFISSYIFSFGLWLFKELVTCNHFIKAGLGAMSVSEWSG